MRRRDLLRLIGAVRGTGDRRAARAAMRTQRMVRRMSELAVIADRAVPAEWKVPAAKVEGYVLDEEWSAIQPAGLGVLADLDEVGAVLDEA